MLDNNAHYSVGINGGVYGATSAVLGAGGAGGFAIQRWNSGNPATLVLGASTSGTIGTFASMASNTVYGRVLFCADDTIILNSGAMIQARTITATSSGSVGSQLEFLTAATGLPTRSSR